MFQQKFLEEVNRRGIATTTSFRPEVSDAILVINSTRHLHWLLSAKRRGIRIVQRLGRPNKLHRYRASSLKTWLAAERANLLMRFIRSRIADHVVYQSQAVANEWNSYSPAEIDHSIIYNGIDLSVFTPDGPRYQGETDICIISVEGTQGNDPYNIAANLQCDLLECGVGVELLVAGTMTSEAAAIYGSLPFTKILGKVENRALPYYYRGATLAISTDIIGAGCPNSVLEALGCGTPVVGYDTGVLPELLTATSGQLVRPNADIWSGQDPSNRMGMVTAALRVSSGNEQFRRDARHLAETRYGIQTMVDAYLDVLEDRR